VGSDAFPASVCMNALSSSACSDASCIQSCVCREIWSPSFFGGDWAGSQMIYTCTEQTLTKSVYES
jgi:hypothetical protein